jgi:hypothetical protein
LAYGLFMTCSKFGPHKQKNTAGLSHIFSISPNIFRIRNFSDRVTAVSASPYIIAGE